MIFFCRINIFIFPA